MVKIWYIKQEIFHMHSVRVFVFCLFVCLFVCFRAAPVAYGSFWARGRIGAASAGLHHSHGNTGFQAHLQPTPQLMATLYPFPTELGQGSNPHPYGHYVRFLTGWATVETPSSVNILTFKICMQGFLSWLSETNLTSIHEDAGSIPDSLSGLNKDLALPWAVM